MEKVKTEEGLCNECGRKIEVTTMRHPVLPIEMESAPYCESCLVIVCWRQRHYCRHPFRDPHPRPKVHP